MGKRKVLCGCCGGEGYVWVVDDDKPKAKRSRKKAGLYEPVHGGTVVSTVALQDFDPRLLRTELRDSDGT